MTSVITEGDNELAGAVSYTNLSLGGVAAMAPLPDPPKKYRKAARGEVSTFSRAGVIPVTRLPNGEVRVLMWLPQSGRKPRIRWYDFGGKKEDTSEFTTQCACRKFAKQTYGVFGCQMDMADAEADVHMKELYQGLCNLPLMLRASTEWAHLQMMEDDPRIFYNDIHEYHAYLLSVPYVPAETLDKVSGLVDQGKRKFKWMSPEELKSVALAPHLHTHRLTEAFERLQDDTFVKAVVYQGPTAKATCCFSAKVV